MFSLLTLVMLLSCFLLTLLLTLLVAVFELKEPPPLPLPPLMEFRLRRRLLMSFIFFQCLAELPNSLAREEGVLFLFCDRADHNNHSIASLYCTITMHERALTLCFSCVLCCRFFSGCLNFEPRHPSHFPFPMI